MTLPSFVFIFSLILGHAEQSQPDFRISVFSTNVNLDPVTVMDGSSALVNRQLFHSLYHYGSRDQLVPELVESHTVSSDGLVYRLKLRSGLHFSDQTEITAEAVVASLTRVANKLGRTVEWGLGKVEGFEKAAAGGRLSGVRADGPRIVEIRLRSPFREFLQILASPNFGIAKEAKGQVLGSDLYFATRPSRDLIVLTPRPANPLFGKIRRLEFRGTPSSERAVSFFKKNKVDFAYNLSSSITSVSEELETLNVITLQLNMRAEPFKEVAQRCLFEDAFARAVREVPEIGSRIKLGLPFTSHIFKTGDPPARRSTSPRKIHLIYIDSIGSFQAEGILQLETALGKHDYALQTEKVTFKEFFKRVKAGTFEAAMWGFGLDYYSPDALLNPLLGSNQLYNFSRFSDATFDRLLETARVATSDAAQADAYEKAFTRITEFCPVSFLGVQRQAFLLRKPFKLRRLPSIGVHMTLLHETLEVGP